MPCARDLAMSASQYAVRPMAPIPTSGDSDGDPQVALKRSERARVTGLGVEQPHIFRRQRETRVAACRDWSRLVGLLSGDDLGGSIAAHTSLQIAQHPSSRMPRVGFSAIGYATALFGEPATLHRRQRVDVIVRQGSEQRNDLVR